MDRKLFFNLLDCCDRRVALLVHQAVPNPASVFEFHVDLLSHHQPTPSVIVLSHDVPSI